MKGKRKERSRDKPVLETDQYRIWDAQGTSKAEEKELKQMCLAVYDGERIHEIVVFNITQERTMKVLSKERISDGKIKVLVKIDKPDNRCSVIRCEAWITQQEYSGLKSAMKKQFGEHCATVISGENLHVGLSHVMDTIEKKQRQEGRGRKAPDTPPKTAHTIRGWLAW